MKQIVLLNKKHSNILNEEQLSEKVSNYTQYLELALERLFTESEKAGFWDPANGRVIKKLDYSNEQGTITWSPDKTGEYRYGPFGLFGVLYWRFTYSQRKKDYDQKILRYLDFLKESVSQSGQVDANSSGWDHALVLICLSLGYLNYANELPDKAKRYLLAGQKIYDYSIKTWKPGGITDNHDLFLIWAYSWLYEALKHSRSQINANTVAQNLKELSDWVCQTQNSQGIFQTGDKLAGRHQRIMYPAAGLGKAAAILGQKQYLSVVEKSLDFVIQCRLSFDGGFVWVSAPRGYQLRKIPPIRWLFPGGANLLFECHQTFFVNAAEQYLQAAGNKDYFPYQIAAMDWIFETNRRKRNLAQECPLEVPWRVMDERGEITIAGQNFKGCYEIGSYIMALSDIIKRAKLRIGEKDRG